MGDELGRRIAEDRGSPSGEGSDAFRSSLRLALEFRKAIRLRDEFLRSAVEAYDAAATEQERMLAAGELVARAQEADKAYGTQIHFGLKKLAQQDGLLIAPREDRRR